MNNPSCHTWGKCCLWFIPSCHTLSSSSNGVVLITPSRGWNSLWVECWACCCSVMQRHGFNPPLRIISLVEGIFSLELTWVWTPIFPSPPPPFGWEYKPRSSLCIHAFHHTDSKDSDMYVRDGWMLATTTHPACPIYEDGMWLPQWLD